MGFWRYAMINHFLALRAHNFILSAPHIMLSGVEA